MKIKTFPLQFTEEELDKIREAAKKKDKTIKDFILIAIKNEIKKGWENEKG